MTRDLPRAAGYAAGASPRPPAAWRRLARAAVLAAFLAPSAASPASLPEGVERIGLVAGGLPRQALVEEPADPISAGHGPWPTIILLHDMDQTPREIRALARLDRAAPFRDWLRVFPQGGNGAWNAGRRRVDGGEAIRTPDVAFLRALVAKLAEDGLADPSRILLAGFGEGGAMVLRTLCDAPGLAWGAAVVAGTWPASQTCPHGLPTPVLMFHGAQDPVVPYAGGQSRTAHRVGSGALASVARTASSLAAMNACRDPRDEPLPGGGRKRIWFACEAPLMQWRIAGMGHRWPGAPDPGREDDGLGPPAPPAAPDATVTIAAFFVSLVEGPRP